MTHGIGWAVKQMWNDYRVCRPSWNGQEMWLVLVRSEDWGAAAVQGDAMQQPWVGIKTADNGFIPWTCSQADLLADDWQLAEEPSG